MDAATVDVGAANATCTMDDALAPEYYALPWRMDAQPTICREHNGVIADTGGNGSKITSTEMKALRGEHCRLEFDWEKASPGASELQR
jgi:hypothetical protein